MNSVVLELQQDALSREVRVSDLLRKALVVARKLKLQEFQKWIENELNGYAGDQEIPDYRESFGQVRAWNPMRGWMPVIMEDPKVGELLSHRRSGQAITELEDLVIGSKSNSQFHMPFPQSLQRQLGRSFGYDTEISLFVDRSSLVGVVETVRTIILNWALKLEEDGILGEGLSFSSTEQESAQRSPQNITNFYGPVESPQIQQGSQKAVQVSASINIDPEGIKSFIMNLRKVLDSLQITNEQKSEVNAEIQTLEAQVNSPKPKTSIVSESMASIRRILEGAGGGVASQLLLEVGKLIF
jgi:hypothetical protein